MLLYQSNFLEAHCLHLVDLLLFYHLLWIFPFPTTHCFWKSQSCSILQFPFLANPLWTRCLRNFLFNFPLAGANYFLYFPMRIYFIESNLIFSSMNSAFINLTSLSMLTNYFSFFFRPELSFFLILIFPT